MKRRWFLGLLFGVPAAPAVAKVLENFPKGLIQESEPKINWETRTAVPMPDYVNCFSAYTSAVPPYVNLINGTWKGVKR